MVGLPLKKMSNGIYPILDFQWFDQGGAGQTVDKGLLERIARVLALLPVPLVQLRCKSGCGQAYRFMALCRTALRTHCPGVGIVVNDRVDLALALQTDGVHVGQEDLPVSVCRRLLGPDRIIGFSTHNLQEVAEAQQSGADYLGFGPVFPTGTKKDTQPVCGLEMLASACHLSKLPVVAIGGIDLETVADIATSGAAAAAMIGGLWRENWPCRLEKAVAQWQGGASRLRG